MRILPFSPATTQKPSSWIKAFGAYAGQGVSHRGSRMTGRCTNSVLQHRGKSPTQGGRAERCPLLAGRMVREAHASAPLQDKSCLTWRFVACHVLRASFTFNEYIEENLLALIEGHDCLPGSEEHLDAGGECEIPLLQLRPLPQWLTLVWAPLRPGRLAAQQLAYRVPLAAQ